MPQLWEGGSMVSSFELEMDAAELLMENMVAYDENAWSPTAVIEGLRKPISRDEVWNSSWTYKEAVEKTW